MGVPGAPGSLPKRAPSDRPEVHSLHKHRTTLGPTLQQKNPPALKESLRREGVARMPAPDEGAREGAPSVPLRCREKSEDAGLDWRIRTRDGPKTSRVATNWTTRPKIVIYMAGDA